MGTQPQIWQETDSQTAKYKNSRATAIFNKSYELYHLDRVKKGSGKAPEIYLMEGFMDVIAAYRAGIDFTIIVIVLLLNFSLRILRFILL